MHPLPVSHFWGTEMDCLSTVPFPQDFWGDEFTHPIELIWFESTCPHRLVYLNNPVGGNLLWGCGTLGTWGLTGICHWGQIIEGYSPVIYFQCNLCLYLVCWTVRRDATAASFHTHTHTPHTQWSHSACLPHDSVRLIKWISGSCQIVCDRKVKNNWKQ